MKQQNELTNGAPPGVLQEFVRLQVKVAAWTGDSNGHTRRTLWAGRQSYQSALRPGFPGTKSPQRDSLSSRFNPEEVVEYVSIDARYSTSTYLPIAG